MDSRDWEQLAGAMDGIDAWYGAVMSIVGKVRAKALEIGVDDDVADHMALVVFHTLQDGETPTHQPPAFVHVLRAIIEEEDDD